MKRLQDWLLDVRVIIEGLFLVLVLGIGCLIGHIILTALRIWCFVYWGGHAKEIASNGYALPDCRRCGKVLD